jgi:DNA-directed RNA polymerase subunit RPC12/RpoP
VGTSPPHKKKKPPPPPPEPEDRHQNIAATTAKRQGLAVMVRQGRRRHRYPVASASLYEPSCQRTWWWISLRCPWCGAVHLHRVRQEQDAGGVRRTGCGRRVFVKVRTVYRGKANVRAVA